MDRTLLSSSVTSKMKGNWEREHTIKFDKDYSYGYPWPPRCYTCSFCQREFKSAQALGGHMNIHRKDRAKLRDLSPDKYPLLSKNSSCQNPNHNHNRNHNPNLNPNPNPMSTLPSPSSCPTNNIYSQPYSLVSLSPSNNFKDDADHSQGVGKCMKMISSVDYPDHNCYNDNKVRLLESNNSAKEVMRLDLGQCLRDAKKDDDLDLELRLGI